MDYFSYQHARPSVSRTTSNYQSTGGTNTSNPATPTPLTPSLLTPSLARGRPNWFRSVTSDTLAHGADEQLHALSLEKRSVNDECIAFAFDIDGVLVKGKKAIDGATETLKMLQDNDIPFIFLTNGGGLTEKDHVAKVGERLGLVFDEDQFVQSHTPFKNLVPKYKDKHILVLGGHGHQIRDLARAYGFEKVLTSSDLIQEWEHIHPFPELTRDHHAEHGLPIDNAEHIEIAAILVWTSPRDWCLDLQVIADLLLSSGGRFGGGRSPNVGNLALPNGGYLQDGQPKLYFCNPDFEWATSHRHPRFAQGAFREALKGVWAHATRGLATLEYTVIGKPTGATYAYAEQVLQAWTQRRNGERGVARRIKTVYMIGDNPESDIKGANEYESRFGSEWKSVLVESGVHPPGTKPSQEPDFVAKNVEHAVHAVLAKEGFELDNGHLQRRLELLDIIDRDYDNEGDVLGQKTRGYHNDS